MKGSNKARCIGTKEENRKAELKALRGSPLLAGPCVCVGGGVSVCLCVCVSLCLCMCESRGADIWSTLGMQPLSMRINAFSKHINKEGAIYGEGALLYNLPVPRPRHVYQISLNHSANIYKARKHFPSYHKSFDSQMSGTSPTPWPMRLFSFPLASSSTKQGLKAQVDSHYHHPDPFPVFTNNQVDDADDPCET